MTNHSRIPLTVTKAGVETRLDTLASWVETKDGLIGGLSRLVGSGVEVAGRNGSMYMRGRHREEKSLVLNIWVNNTDVDGLTPSYQVFRKNLDEINKLFDTTNSQITLTEYIGGTYGDTNALTRVNLSPNPDFRATTGTVIVRTNLATNPSSEGNGPGVKTNDGTQWQAERDTGFSRSGSASARTVVMNRKDGVVSSVYDVGQVTPTVVRPGQTITFSCYVAHDIAAEVHTMVYFAFLDADGNYVSAAGQREVSIGSARKTWTRISTTVTIPADISQIRAAVNVSRAGTAQPGDSVWFDDVLIEEAPDVRPFFDGSTPTGFDLNLEAAWGSGGTSNATGRALADWTNTPVNSRAWQAEDGHSAYVRNTSAAVWGAGTAPLYNAIAQPVPAGVAVSASLRVVSQPKSSSVYTTIQGYAASGAGTSGSPGSAFAAANGDVVTVNGWTPPAGTAGVRQIIRVAGNSVYPGDTIRVEQSLIELTSTAGDYFDGDSQGAAWVGTNQRSASVLSSPGARKAVVEVRSQYVPDYTDGFEHAKVKIECVINSGVWSDVGTYTFTSASGASILNKTMTLTPLVGGTAEIEDAFIVIDGPVNSPKLVDPTNDSVLQLQTNVPAGQQWVVNCATYESYMGTNIEQNPRQGTNMARYTFTSGPLAPSMFPIHPNASVTFNGSSGGTTTRLRITAGRKYH